MNIEKMKANITPCYNENGVFLYMLLEYLDTIRVMSSVHHNKGNIIVLTKEEVNHLLVMYTKLKPLLEAAFFAVAIPATGDASSNSVYLFIDTRGDAVLGFAFPDETFMNPREPSIRIGKEHVSTFMSHLEEALFRLKDCPKTS